MAPIAQAVTVSLGELREGTVTFETLRKAFGPDSLGILVVRDVPPQFHELRRQVLSFSSYLGNLPQEELAKLENAKAKYLTGWSLGKETLKNGQVDNLKGSFYVNCGAFYVDTSSGDAASAGSYTIDSFPEYLSPNVWPDEAVLPGFQAAVETLCRLVIDVAVLVARACDRFAAGEIAGYPNGYLENMVKTSTTTKARLLHYFPSKQREPAGAAAGSGDDGEDDDWCATHLDHGCLTGLTSAMFVDESGIQPGSLPPSTSGPLTELPASPDEKSGLYIRSRAGETVQVKIPRDSLAFQTGEALERITEGRFKAVPHFVRGATNKSTAGRIARNTLAVFTQPNLGDLIDIRNGISFGEFARGIVAKNTVG